MYKSALYNSGFTLHINKKLKLLKATNYFLFVNEEKKDIY